MEHECILDYINKMEHECVRLHKMEPPAETQPLKGPFQLREKAVQSLSCPAVGVEHHDEVSDERGMRRVAQRGRPAPEVSTLAPGFSHS